MATTQSQDFIAARNKRGVSSLPGSSAGFEGVEGVWSPGIHSPILQLTKITENHYGFSIKNQKWFLVVYFN